MGIQDSIGRGPIEFVNCTSLISLFGTLSKKKRKRKKQTEVSSEQLVSK
jgi:hypothetical protein